jgi:hypothetical protein
MPIRMSLNTWLTSSKAAASLLCSLPLLLSRRKSNLSTVEAT